MDKNIFARNVEKESEVRNKALESQMKLNDVQAEYIKAKAESLKRGDAVIQIDSTGLEPALEIVMWNIIQKVQIRANEESADFLRRTAFTLAARILGLNGFVT